MTERRFTVAAVQSEPVWFDLEATTHKTLGLIREAAASGANLVAFPEVWLPGYPVFLWLGTDEWQGDYRETYIANSPKLGGPEHRLIAGAAAEHGIQVVLGVSELDEDGRIYMGQWIIDENGETVLTRRKLKPSSVEGSFFAPGEPVVDLKVIDTSIGTIGALNCSEHKRPLLRHVMYGLEEEIHVAAWPAFGLVPEVITMGAKVNIGATSFYAAEGGMFVLAPTQVIGAALAEHFSDTPERARKISVGGGATHIFGPDGQDVTPPLAHDTDGLLVAEIDLAQVRRPFDADPLSGMTIS